MARFRSIPALFFSALLAAGLTSGAAAADKGDNLASAQERYRLERAACLNGRSHQDRETCLKEATNALTEARNNPQPPTDPQILQENALARCDNVHEQDRPACKRMAMGQGKVSGSVEGGGVIKEVVTRKVGPAAASAPR